MDVAIAGGLESMTMIPMGGNKVSANPSLVQNYPDVYLSMGLTAERLATRFGITRERGDAFSYQSHQKALKAIEAGHFKDETIPVTVSNVSFEPTKSVSPAGVGAKMKREEFVFAIDEGPRADTTLEALANLKPAFHVKGTVTAGNSSQMSDGAAATVVMSAEKAQALGIKPLVRFVAFATAGYKPEEMGLGPVYAIPKALKQAGLTLDQIDVIELNEAFAAQSLAVIQEAGLDPAKVNPNGGAIALGHPLGCTGAKLTATIIRELQRRNGRYGMVTMCVGGGMGAAGIFETMG
jgi:acetyl-CoA acyltransferase